ncbi:MULTISPECIES: ferredoxin [Micrococcaceae]|uniref:ferredoxin n=1 Tax=Micrococcaceae TaxID=1268 RepID=UPI0017D7228F|nr:MULTISPECIES: ferredoxin [Micrococcaceae]MBB5750584.1 ferredoxin [Micrococcus sp. TA1]HRO28812.1 ferredoxin [Citricoccus sp.]HRO92343.1 ferredoxin [Citricoccus sp.]
MSTTHVDSSREAARAPRDEEQSMKVWVDRTLCENHGQCAIAAPNTFEMDEEGILQYTEGFPAGELEYIEDAMDVCPVQAIFLKGDQ